METFVGTGTALGDSKIWLYEPDATGTDIELLTSNDDGGEGLYSLIERDLEAGDYFVLVEYYWSGDLTDGEYRLEVTAE